MTAWTTIDSFKFLWQQIEQDCRHAIGASWDAMAVVGGLYSAFLVYRATKNILGYVSSSIVGDRGVHWVEQYGPWAVVTGSSEGIGRAYAEELAQRGLNVVLISRSEHKLAKAKEEIESASRVQVEYIVADFSSSDQAELFSKIKNQLDGKEVGLLVNNVGMMYDYPELFLQVRQEKLSQIINVNVGAATMMTHMLLPAMVERGKGGVVVVTSGTSLQISPLMTVYAASKKYLDYFIESLAFEYRGSGVTFQRLVPFFTATRMTQYSDNLKDTGFVVPNASRYVRSAVRTLGRSFLTTGYFPFQLQFWVIKLIPSWIFKRLMENLNSGLKKDALANLATKSEKTKSASEVSGIAS